MNTKRRDSEIFSMAFLDVVCCGFGAMVLLVLLAKSDVVGGLLDAESAVQFARALQTATTEHRAQEQRMENLQAQLRALPSAAPATEVNLPALQQRIVDLQLDIAALQRQAQQSENRAAAVAAVGGIPVDSEHIIFLVDTSGSMREPRLWPRVLQEMENILDIHPRVRGFQIMNDNGLYLMKAYARKWIPDTPVRRRAVLERMQTWHRVSNSNPVVGLKNALNTYRSTPNLAIYILGDDYSGGPYDAVLDTIAELNRSATGQPRARIHGLGFLDDQRSGFLYYGHAEESGAKFATLMREVARQNRGAFIALGRK